MIGKEEGGGGKGWERATPRKGPSTMDRLGDSETSGPGEILNGRRMRILPIPWTEIAGQCIQENEC